jgi:hypothetical protein
MTDKKGEVVEANVQNGNVVYKAEYPDGTWVRGVWGKSIAGPNTQLSKDGLENLAEEIVGKPVDPLPEWAQ